MPQPNWPVVERRIHRRHLRAFAFWVQRTDVNRRDSAWMLNTSDGGAAFLTAAEPPSVGERIELAEMHCNDRMVRDGARPLPPAAEVIRVDSASEVTCRVAVRFLSEVDSPLERRLRQGTHVGLCAAIAPGEPPPGHSDVLA